MSAPTKPPTARKGRPSAWRDLVVVAVATVALLIGAFTGVFAQVHSWMDDLSEGTTDAVFGALLVGGLTATVIALIRRQESRREASLRSETEARFQAMVEQVPAVAYTWDTTLPTGQAPAVYISPQLESMLGYTPEEWSAHPERWLEVIHPDDRERVRLASDEADRTGTAFHAEYRAFAKDGRMIWIRDDSVPVARDERGNALRAQGVMYDVTRQKEAEERLQEAENRYRTIVERVPAVAYVWDSAYRPGSAPASYISPQIEQLLGFSPQAWLDEPAMWEHQLHPDDVEDVLQRWSAAADSASTFVAEYRIRSASGEQVWVRDEAVPVADGAGGHPIYQGVMYDITEQRIAQDQLAAAEERYRSLVENLPVVTYVSDVDDGEHVRYVAPGIEALTGFTASEWLETPGLWVSMIHPEDRDQVVARSRGTDRSLTEFDVEYRLVRKDGRTVWVHDHAVVVQHENGTMVWQGVMQDTTARRDAERALGHVEERFRRLVEQIPAITYVEDPVTGKNLYISPQIEQVLGYSPDEGIADPTLWERHLHPDDRDWVVAANDAASGDLWSVDYRAFAREGRLVWLHNEAVLIRDEAGQPLFWQGVVFDITERKEAEERLRTAEERYRSLVEQLPAVVYIDAVDDIATAEYISPQYERLTGYSPQQRLADPELWVHMLHPDDREATLRESNRTNRTGEPFDQEYRIVRSDGEMRWVRDQAFMIQGEDGAQAWQGVLTDITDRKVAEDALARRDRILEAAGYAAERLLRAPTWRECIDEVLQALGEGGTATRATLFENLEVDGAPCVALRHAWLANDAPVQLDRPPSTPYPYGEDFERWRQVLGGGGVIHGAASVLPERERVMVEGAGIKALIAVPVHVEGTWWGYIGFDQCDRDREWQPAEIDAIRVAANTLGAAIERERAAVRLGETEARYRTLIEQIPAITYIEDSREGSAVYTSPQMTTLLGYGPDEWGRHDQWRAAIHPEDRDRVIAEDDRTNATGDTFRMEYRLLAKDRSIVWVRDEAVLLRDDDGEHRFWQGVRFDISAEKAVEEQLRDAEERYRGLIETIPAVTYIDSVDSLSDAVYTSPQVEDVFGYTAEEWTSDANLWERGVHPDDRDEVVEKVERLNRDGTPYHAEYRFVRPDGRVVWVSDHAVVLRDEQGNPRFSQGVFFDITGRKEAEEQLREAEERYRAIVEHVPAAIYLDAADRSMRTVYISPQIEEITGVSAEEWIADPELWLKIVPQEDRDAVERGYLESISHDLPWKAEYRMQTRDGRMIWIHDETTILHDADGNPTYLQGVLMDVTERKLAEQALRESEQRERDAAERLRALDDMKNTFLAAVSHELRSPLTSILGLSITLERSPDMDETDRQDLLSRLSVNARKLERLLKDLLDIDRLNRGIVTPQYRTVDVGALARRTVESMDAVAERTVIVDASPVVLSIDPPKIERIVENLVMNAARHTAADRTIWLKVGPRDGGVLLTVEDDGPGVPDDLREAIFEPFRQGPTASPHAPGTGIGLSLVGRFAELHGGRAWVEDRPGGGASFQVLLPAGPEIADDLGTEEPATAQQH